jgi:hypothetical protein
VSRVVHNPEFESTTWRFRPWGKSALTGSGSGDNL